MSDMVSRPSDRRGDPAYSDWDEEARAYEKDAEEGMKILQQNYQADRIYFQDEGRGGQTV